MAIQLKRTFRHLGFTEPEQTVNGYLLFLRRLGYAQIVLIGQVCLFVSCLAEQCSLLIATDGTY